LCASGVLVVLLGVRLLFAEEDEGREEVDPGNAPGEEVAVVPSVRLKPL
jgi:small neutral amino acid transporter SnatA (MarC family)